MRVVSFVKPAPLSASMRPWMRVLAPTSRNRGMWKASIWKCRMSKRCELRRSLSSMIM